jgi:hypothetical protein
MLKRLFGCLESCFILLKQRPEVREERTPASATATALPSPTGIEVRGQGGRTFSLRNSNNTAITYRYRGQRSGRRGHLASATATTLPSPTGIEVRGQAREDI